MFSIVSLYRQAALWLMSTSVYNNFVLKVLPYIRLSLYYTSIRGWQYRRGYQLLQDGDIFLSYDKKKLSTFIIPGQFSHAGLCVGKGEQWEISEMTQKDYTKSTFFDVCKEADRVVIIRCKDFDPEYIKHTLIPACKNLSDAKYDAAFELGVQALYCSELVYQADVEKRLKVDLSDLAGLGRPYLSPDGLFKAKNCELIWDSEKEVEYPQLP